MVQEVGGRVGIQNSGDGTKPHLRQGKESDLIVSQLMGSLYEAASRSKLFIASIGAAGVAPGTALGTAPPIAVHNPASSGILVAIRKVYVGYVSGTLGAGQLVHAYAVQAAAPSSGTELTPVTAFLGGARGAAKAYTGSTIAATATIIRPSFNLGAGLASTAELPKAPMFDPVEGEIVVPAGYVWCLQGISAAGSTPLITIGVVYQEITVP
ncbi:MAG: hypothetical protein NUV34_06945 [Sulfuricaulis sp.]|nr:hypothetical protein [Sulfuricaulis sp.]